MTGTVAEAPAPSDDPLGRFMRENLERYFAEANGARCAPFAGPLRFEGPFASTRPTVFVVPGRTRAEPGDVLMVETPTRRGYELSWRVDYDSAVPDAVKAKANLRMAVAGAGAALVWVVGDNGTIDEMHRIRRDEATIERMREGCLEAEAGAAIGLEPAPDDADLADYIVARRDEATEVLVRDERSREGIALTAIEDLQREAAAATATERRSKQEQNAHRNVLLRALAGRKALRIGDRIVRSTVVEVEERLKRSYRFTRIDVETIDGGA